MKTQYHESAYMHVTGTAVYTDDLEICPKPLLGYAITSPVAKGILKDFDFSEALKIEGVYAILSHKDIKGEKKVGAVFADEPVLVEKEISYIGQALFIVAAANEKAFQKAKESIKFTIEEQKPVLTIEEAKQKGLLLDKHRKIERGNLEEGFKNSYKIIEGITTNTAQEHWYLETQCCVAVPLENNEIKIYSSTQNPREVQMFVSEVLHIPSNCVEVEVRRMGGAFGGKETQGATIALWAALLAQKTGKPVKVRLQRHIDQMLTGKRHPFETEYKVGFDKEGKILAAEINLNANGGAFADLSLAILERAMFHSDNAYFIPNFRIIGNVWLTNLPPNTAFRGFGAPQGILNIENIIEKISRILKKDVIEIQKLNFYGINENNQTPYRQIVENNNIHKIYDQLIEKSNYYERRKEIEQFNKENKYKKRGIAATPVKFGISFTTAFLNQAGALVHVYTDGTVLVNHGGTEMGQGLHTKMQKITSREFGIDIDKIRVNATNTAKVPNTSATAASTGSDINGMAVKDAIDKIKVNINSVVAEFFNSENNDNKTKTENLIYSDNFITDKENPQRKIEFEKAANLTRLKMKSLSSTGFYATPGIIFDREKGQGTPFFYYTFGMAISEIELDILTSKVSMIRTDIIQDVGASINNDIDIGQIQGAFIQCVGWSMIEHQKYDNNGKNITSSPDTYKIPAIGDKPKIFNVDLLSNASNKNTIQGSKAVGEPPFILGFSVWFATKDALWALSEYKIEPQLNFPATNEYIAIASQQILDSLKK